jgi:hypothetical protein
MTMGTEHHSAFRNPQIMNPNTSTQIETKHSLSIECGPNNGEDQFPQLNLAMLIEPLWNELQRCINLERLRGQFLIQPRMTAHSINPARPYEWVSMTLSGEPQRLVTPEPIKWIIANYGEKDKLAVTFEWESKAYVSSFSGTAGSGDLGNHSLHGYRRIGVRDIKVRGQVDEMVRSLAEQRGLKGIVELERQGSEPGYRRF